MLEYTTTGTKKFVYFETNVQLQIWFTTSKRDDTFTFGRSWKADGEGNFTVITWACASKITKYGTTFSTHYWPSKKSWCGDRTVERLFLSAEDVFSNKRMVMPNRLDRRQGLMPSCRCCRLHWYFIWPHVFIYDYKEPVLWWPLPSRQHIKSQIKNSARYRLVHRMQQCILCVKEAHTISIEHRWQVGAKTDSNPVCAVRKNCGVA